MAKKRTIQVNGDNVVVIRQQSEDYISLTDMARFKNAEATGLVISHWLSTRYAVDFLGSYLGSHPSRSSSPTIPTRATILHLPIQALNAQRVASCASCAIF